MEYPDYTLCHLDPSYYALPPVEPLSITKEPSKVTCKVCQKSMKKAVSRAYNTIEAYRL